VELSNLQRQVLYDEQDVHDRLPKAEAAAAKLRRINSEIVIEPHVADVTCTNVIELIRNADVILDGTDNFETRFLINDAAVETRTPWVHGGCVGSHGQVMVIVPGRTPCLRCLMPDIPGPGTSETCDTAGVIGPAVQIVASMQTIAGLKILTGQMELIRPVLTIVDAWDGLVRHLGTEALARQGNCPCCGRGERPWLHGQAGSQTAVMCGRNSVQVSPSQRSTLSLDQLAERLRASGQVRTNPFLVVFRPTGEAYELTVFRDGRVIVGGTEDVATAKGIAARYVGS
jgi:adenylyltransferase/sulfurtransferase